MDFAIFLLLTSSFIINFFSLAVLSFAYFTKHSRLIIGFALFVLSIVFRQIFYTFLEYRLAISPYGYVYSMTTVNYMIASLTIFTLPFLCHEWLEIPHARQRNLIFTGLSLLSMALVAISPMLIPSYLDSFPDPFHVTAQPTFRIYQAIQFFSMAYVIFIGFRHFKQVERIEERWFLFISLTAIGIWLFLEAFDPIKSFPENMIPGSAVLLIWNPILYWYLFKIHIYRKSEPICLEEFYERFKITEREKEVVDLIALGESNKGIAQKLYLSEATVKTHIINIYRKLDVKNRVQLVNLIKSRQNDTGDGTPVS